jgi:hypothetical protein
VRKKCLWHLMESLRWSPLSSEAYWIQRLKQKLDKMGYMDRQSDFLIVHQADISPTPYTPAVEAGP